jgi:hypothetical protein
VPARLFVTLLEVIEYLELSANWDVLGQLHWFAWNGQPVPRWPFLLLILLFVQLLHVNLAARGGA